MKKLVLLVSAFFVLSVIPAFSGLTKEYLQSTQWGPEKGYMYFGTYMFFYNTSVKFIQKNQGGRICQELKYHISNNKLVIEFNINFNDPANPEFVDLVYSLKKSDTSFYLENYLALENPGVMKGNVNEWIVNEIAEMWDSRSKVKSGTVRIINGVRIAVMDHVEAVTTDNLSIRQTPSAEGKKYIIFLMEFDKEFSYLPKGQSVRIIGRTEEKKKTGNMINYWYYIEPLLGWEDNIRPDGADYLPEGKNDFWSFGEFLKITNKAEIKAINEADILQWCE